MRNTDAKPIARSCACSYGSAVRAKWVLMGIGSGPFRKKIYPTRRAGKVLMKITDTEPIARS